jgi:hypothetical protein
MPVQQLILAGPTRNAGQEHLALAGGQWAVRAHDSGLARSGDIGSGDTSSDVRHDTPGGNEKQGSKGAAHRDKT